MKRMPESLLIGTVAFDVVVDNDAWVRMEHEQRSTGLYGFTNCTLAKIYLNPDHPAAVQRLTLWHEVLHALAETVMGKPEWTDLGDDTEAREERVIRLWEHSTLAVLRDNPQLVAYLTDDRPRA